MATKPGLDITDLAKLEFEEPWRLMGPWLTDRCLALLYAERGLGKTHFALALALAIAHSQPFLCWEPETRIRTLYIDGEMGPQNMRNLIGRIDPDFATIPEGAFRLLTFADCGGVVWNLADHADQRRYDAMIQDFDLIIFDNYLTCIRQIRRETDTELWSRVQPWAIQKREARKSILFIHHSGKQPTQLGTSTKENAMNTIIALRPHYDDPGFELHFEKARDFYGQDKDALYVSFHDSDLGLAWSWRKLEEKRVDRVAELRKLGWSLLDIANALHIQPGKVREYERKTNSGRDTGVEEHPRKDIDADIF